MQSVLSVNRIVLSFGSKETKFDRHLFIKEHQNVLGPITTRREFGTVLQLPPTIQTEHALFCTISLHRRETIFKNIVDSPK